ncbi:cytochrome P450 [Gloeophyllum trabeum ATCC 11539]|uniref:Cytochrome P450 n=1 Tax=Gloeophyllum trabeum (strain ATCC 11539 / FP-39264 / Madison 617) TaxID=670483 RepID=S7RRB6_GLOTA|nr:cytochrome P450 [Gloeophyllum trabeum ATCC 11539]EPQ55474.1 cytochrome P450 [Gloeophyllum trabeum ATCC 11539]
MISIVQVTLLLSLVACVYVYRRRHRISLSDVPGPKSASLLFGHLREFYQLGAGKADLEWTKTYGSIVRFKGSFGVDQLMISDPKALQYILHTSAYQFPKSTGARRAVGLLVNGPSIISVDGDVHKRQRKVMLPAFGAPEAKALYPVFKSHSEELMSRWSDLLSSEGEPQEVNVPSWLSRATLDAIGEAAFDYQFGALDNSETELGKVYRDIVPALFGTNTDKRLLMDSLLDSIPARFIVHLYRRLPGRRFERMRETSEATYKIARQLVAEKYDALLSGKGNKDVMSLLVKANASENPAKRLTDEELYAQMRVILFAGHETTSNSLAWALWELAKHPEIQTRLRKEIRETEARVRASGQAELDLSDVESMPYLQAVLKESMRIHPAVGRIIRIAGGDKVIPLSRPLRLNSGNVVNELAVPHGTKLALSISAYNSRDPDIWGDDADKFNPDRWLLEHQKHDDHHLVGVVGNLMTFSSGTRACIGWRFAMVEMQTFLVDLVRNFEFSTTGRDDKIRRQGSGLVFAVVEGEEKDGVKLPLRIRAAVRH